MPYQLLAATDAVAVGVSVVATLVVIALVSAVAHLLRAARELRRQAEELARDAGELLAEMHADLRQAGAQVERVEHLVGSAEAISDAVGGASRLVGGVVAAPLIKVVAFASGVGSALRALQGRPPRAFAPPGGRQREVVAVAPGPRQKALPPLDRRRRRLRPRVASRRGSP